MAHSLRHQSIVGGKSIVGNTTLDSLTGPTEERRRTIQRATDSERAGAEVLAQPLDEEARWWPPQEGRAFAAGGEMSTNHTRVRRTDGLNVRILEHMPSPYRPNTDGYAEETLLSPEKASFLMTDEVHNQTLRMVAPATFDPAVDEIDDDSFQDQDVLLDINRAIEEDRKRLEAFGNPVTLEEQLDHLLQPQRQTQENAAQRNEFNGFAHWGLLHAAHMVMDDNMDTKKAHELINRYLRDLDLFKEWLKHPKVVAHLNKKFNIDMTNKFDPLMANVMALYARSKAQVIEDDAGGAMKSLTGCVSMIGEAANLKLERHRKAYGAVLVARGMVYCKLKSYERSDDDLTRALEFVNANRSATLFQLRAEAREGLGRIEEARQDEETAAMIWEEADVVRPGMTGERMKFAN